MQLSEALPRILTRHTTRRWRRPRRALAFCLRLVGAFLFLVAGGPMAIGRCLMKASGRANGAAYVVERDL